MRQRVQHRKSGIIVHNHYWIQFGVMGWTGRFHSLETIRYQRETSVVCRTDRGLEIGRVLGPGDGPLEVPCSGSLIRRMSVQDELLLVRLEKDRAAACQACVELLQDQGFDNVLLDAEVLFDGKSLVFYFLGEVSQELARLTDQLSDTYQAAVSFQQFSTALEEGCGPGCGTESAAGGCDSSGCASCSVASHCKNSSSTDQLVDA
jgi:cell fate regulator YaaT (PSP1 superfamily)